MNKNNNIIKFYVLANKLKEVIRKGWMDVEIKKERLESVAEHIYGCLMLAIAIDSEYDLNLDMYKVLKMISLHELEEIIMSDITIVNRSLDKITKENKLEYGKECVHKVVKGLSSASEIEKLIDEFNERKTKEACFCYHIDKIECDFQAKMYDLEGAFDYDKAYDDSEYYGDRKESIRDIAKTSSDFWIEYDRPKYDDDKLFKNLIEDIKSINTLFNNENI